MADLADLRLELESIRAAVSEREQIAADLDRMSRELQIRNHRTEPLRSRVAEVEEVANSQTREEEHLSEALRRVAASHDGHSSETVTGVIGFILMILEQPRIGVAP
ncbi:hypothetical protein [Microtetraspora glauca]|uniref:Uncharacterized protein n=1 Tax=Microtetraspora glauca TaxID=1996 RepID=A0ABV3G9G3_MICGL